MRVDFIPFLFTIKFLKVNFWEPELKVKQIQHSWAHPVYFQEVVIIDGYKDR